MIIYNKTALANLRLQDEVKRDVAGGYITDAEFRAIAEKYPVGFYTPNPFVRIGLFILTFIIVLFADGLISLVFASSGIIENFGWFIFLALLTYIALELIIRNNSHYRSGVDDALLLIAGCQFVLGAGILFYHNLDNYYLILSAIVFVTCLYLSLRFTDMLTTAICCISFFSLIFFGWIKIIPAGLSTAPFIMMLVTAGAYWLAYKYDKEKEYINYANCLVIIQVVSLIALYAAGNYYVIKTLSGNMAGKTGPVPFGIFFWIWTIILPFAYIGIGIKKKNVVLLRAGLLLITAAALTFRTYYHVLPVDVSLTIVGALILGIVYGVTKYLKKPKHGFTYAATDEVNLMDHLKIESLIVAETFSHAPAAPTNDGVKFGGGDFGGGGSSGNF